jgi:death-on-curing protein
MKDFISKDEVLFLHQVNIEAFGGSLGIRDERLLESALAQPGMSAFGEDAYPTLNEKVAALGFSLIMNHAFVDGNKRVGFSAMAAALKREGFELNCTTEEGVSITMAVAAGECSRPDLTAWIEKHTCGEINK